LAVQGAVLGQSKFAKESASADVGFVPRTYARVAVRTRSFGGFLKEHVVNLVDSFPIENWSWWRWVTSGRMDHCIAGQRHRAGDCGSMGWLWQRRVQAYVLALLVFAWCNMTNLVRAWSCPRSSSSKRAVGLRMASLTDDTVAPSVSWFSSSTRNEKLAIPTSLSSPSLSNSPCCPKQGYGSSIVLTPEERQLFQLLRRVVQETCSTSTTLRVAGGWVRDKLLQTPAFSRSKTTSAYSQGSMGRQGTKIMRPQAQQQQPVDIDIALDDMMGCEFAQRLNQYLADHGERSVSIGVVLQNPLKSKHLETATVQVGQFWIDFVNLRSEEYTSSRIPAVTRIGTPHQDALRRDLTINALFYNVHTRQVEDWTGRGFRDLRRGLLATPAAPLETLLDDPLRVLRSVRFAARLGFELDPALWRAAQTVPVRTALAQKVSRERVGSEVELMLQSPAPVQAMQLLSELQLLDTVFPLAQNWPEAAATATPDDDDDILRPITSPRLRAQPCFQRGLALLSATHQECQYDLQQQQQHDSTASDATDSDETLLWYAAFLKPWHDATGKSALQQLLIHDLKRPTRKAAQVERLLQAADALKIMSSSNFTAILEHDLQVTADGTCWFEGRVVDSVTETHPVWKQAMELRQTAAHVVANLGTLSWRTALVLARAEMIVTAATSPDDIRQRYRDFATALQQLALEHKEHGLNGRQLAQILPRLPAGPTFGDVMRAQADWLVQHPGAGTDALRDYLQQAFVQYT
jgi:tRNA nucleotidyltransferase/poly(A) polymerase